MPVAANQALTFDYYVILGKGQGLDGSKRCEELKTLLLELIECSVTLFVAFR